MKSAPLPTNEADRLAAVHSYEEIRDVVAKSLDDLTEIASQVCGTPIALVSIVDEERQSFWSRVGLDATETPREVAFCSHAILEDDVFEIENADVDLRFFDNPIVTGAPHVKFYAGAPLMTPSGQKIGTLCAIDHQPNQLNAMQRRQLEVLAKQVVNQLELAKRVEAVNELLGAKTELVAELHARQDDLEQFAYRASHDIRGPMLRAGRIAELALEDLEDGEYAEVENNLQRIITSTARLSRLVVDILALSHADLATTPALSVDLDALVDDVVRSYSEDAGESGIEIRATSSGLGRASTEAPRVQQILNNLVSNAVKYADRAKDAPFVEVVASIKDERLHVTVEDNGLGIPMNQSERVFKMFERLHPGAAEGTGLGMSIVKKHVEALNGVIDFQSEVGVGTKFVVDLPAPRSRGRK